VGPRAFVPFFAACLAACPAGRDGGDPQTPAPPASPSPAPAFTAPSSASLATSAEPATSASSVPDAGSVPALDPAAFLFPDAATTPPGAAACLRIEGVRERTSCLFSTRYDGDPEALRSATALFEGTGSVAGVQVEQDLEGGFRGDIHIVPEVPLGRHRRHLAWVAAAMRDFDAFFADLAAPSPPRYRVKPLAFRFFRSVGRTTPSAYAEGWSVSYNVSGSLFGGADAVRETLFHEIFHLNDAAHGDWSAAHLRADFDAIVARCGTRVACLRPYAPGDTMVRGGTYYAFQPDNGDSVHEYAAELALRWYREQRAARRAEALGRPAFKCGPEENRRSWEALVAEFFGGADAAPRCR
jgi:hypothetical protein